jgi:hypothetical protein
MKIDPGTPEARRAWLDSLPVGQRLADDMGYPIIKWGDGWRDCSGVDWREYDPLDEELMARWCSRDEHWPAMLSAPERANMHDTAAAIVEWQAATFGAPGDPLVTLGKLLDEVAELRAELRQSPVPGTEDACEARELEELADVVFIALDLSRGMGGPDALAAAMAEKLERNRQRAWAQDSTGKWSGSK